MCDKHHIVTKSIEHIHYKYIYFFYSPNTSTPFILNKFQVQRNELQYRYVPEERVHTHIFRITAFGLHLGH